MTTAEVQVRGIHGEIDARTAEGPTLSDRPVPATSEWRGFGTITHPAGDKPDEPAGQVVMHMHCIGPLSLL